MAGRELPDRDERRAAVGASRARFAQQGLTAAVIAAVAFACYHATLLPGLDLGDSASFQTGVGSLTLTPRQGYPLYYALGNVFVWLYPGEPAAALNFASAVYAAIAVGIATWLAAELAESLVSGAAAGLFLAFSYTWWTQAITAEVYTLHLLMVGATTLTLLWWSRRPTIGRLGLFYACVALAFGNHLSTVLLLPGFVVFLLIHRAHGGRADPLRPSMLVLAAALAVAGALQYAWNFRGLWAMAEPPCCLTDALDQFWFDVTKADWRETLVMTVSESGLLSRPAMYQFDVHQQFGLPGMFLAIVGALYVAVRWPSRACLLLLLFAANLAFAWNYNVGDVYVFFLPSHYFIALAAGAGVGAIVFAVSKAFPSITAAAVGLACLAYPAWRGYDTLPAVDRSDDTRAIRLLDAITSPPAGRTATGFVYGLDANWQVQNAIEYYMGHHKPGIPWFVTAELRPPDELDEPVDAAEIARNAFALTSGNGEIGRDVIVTQAAQAKLTGVGLSMTPVDATTTLLSQVKATPAGTPYALGVLWPDREYPLDVEQLRAVCRWLTGGTLDAPQPQRYSIIVGELGRPPVLVESRARPFRARATVGGLAFDVRMESWLPTDTIRRAGFGHVIVNRRHLLTLERGISFASVDPGSRPVYSSSLFARIPRYLLEIPRPQ